MKITRKFTPAGADPFGSTEWVTRSSRILNPDGSVVFEMADAEVPKAWSQLATDIMVSKYFRKAGVPVDGGPNGIASPGSDGATKRRSDGGGGEATKRRSDGATKGEEQEPETGPERSAKQVIHRLAGCWRHWGEKHGYFDSKADAQAFYDELVHMMVHQMAAPNSPQWFNTGLHWAYGINGPAQGHWYVDGETGQVKRSEDAYTHPQPHACFIQSVGDDLVNEGGIMDLWVREARLFKYGSGTGTNFSKLRAESERLSGGGKSSGLMSWLKIGDRAAGAIKSGGTTRRAAKMVCLDMDHPDIEKFINWKVREEVKVAALVEGMKHLTDEQRETAEHLGLSLDYDFNGEAYQTVSGQNANNSVRIPDAFFDALDEGADWRLTARTTGEVLRSVPARELWDQVAYAAWRCADPGVQYDSTINAWHTCPNSGRINASNPCSEYMFLDNTACNLASINLLKFYDAERRTFDVELFEHAVDLWTTVLEISVLMAQYPSREIALLSHEYRTLGLGYANIGAMLMQAGIAYDSNEARAVCGAITAIMTGRAFRMSALMARELGAFSGYRKNKKAMLRVIRNHRRAAHGVSRSGDEWEGLNIRPVPIDHELFEGEMGEGITIANRSVLLEHATGAWDEALELGEANGYRNAQVTVIAPTGTIGLLMDCDTTGVEPDFALVKFKKLAGGGYFKIANQSVRPALEALGYTEEEIRDILRSVLGPLSFDVPVPSRDGSADLEMSFETWLRDRGLSDDDLARAADSLPGVFELGFAFSAWALGDEALERVGVDPAEARAEAGFNLLGRLGLNPTQVEILNERVCGTQTIEGAPHLKDEHLPVFDCANACGRKGTRFISAEGHIRMMAAAQPFISGAISKTINLPNSATREDIAAAYRLSWELGLKANALYRDGCKLSQPLSTKSSDGNACTDDEQPGRATDVRLLSLDEEDEEGVEAARKEVTVEMARLGAAMVEGKERVVEKVVERIVHRPMRRRLPDTRQSLTHKFNVAGHEGYLTVGLYEDGSPGELFITMSKEGSTIGGLMDSLGTATSVALQYGVPIDSLVRKFTHQRFEPAGITANRDIPMAKSLVDYIFRWLGIEFVPGYREQVVPRRASEGLGAERDADAGAGRAPAERAARGEVGGRAELARRGAPGEIGAGGVTGGGNGNAGAVGGAGGGAGGGVGGGAGGGAGAMVGVSEKTRTRVVLSSEMETARLLGGPRDALSSSMAEFQEDAPACEVCGTITVRNGTCYRCMNCGNSMGCS